MRERLEQLGETSLGCRLHFLDVPCELVATRLEARESGADQHQSGNAVWVREREVDGNATAHREANDDRTGDFECVEQQPQIVLVGERYRVTVRPPVRAHVVSDRAVALCNGIELSVPHAVIEEAATADLQRARLAAALEGPEPVGRLESEFVSQLLGAIAASVSPDRPRLRAALAATHLTGVTVCRYLMGGGPLAEMELGELVRGTGAALQRLLTGPLPQQP